ncbi:MAG: YdeI/OmpD-associated family protein [Chitinophagaceae bacterium]|nr:YdeI/OmpD-associated family protein [Chitinophagaceae bacterium]
MPTPVADKLKIKPGHILLPLNTPAGFVKGLGKLPAGATVKPGAKTFDQVHWFVLNRQQMEKEMGKVMKLLKPGITVWVYYPKVTSKIQTDLTRDKGWDCLLAESDKLAWISLVSFDDTWSVFGFRAKTEADKKKDAKPKPEREVFNWVNPETKEVKLPADVEASLKKQKAVNEYFQSLAFTHKKEYLEWIVTAKKAETRLARLAKMMEMLGKKWKNPANR